jgi:hypothetical protein
MLAAKPTIEQFKALTDDQAAVFVLWALKSLRADAQEVEILNAVTAAPRYDQQDTRHRDDAGRRKLDRALALLIWKGLAYSTVYDGLSMRFNLTALGEGLEETALDAGILSAAAFLAKHPEATTWDEVVQFYFSQALEAYEKLLPVASQFLLGAAAERALIHLGEDHMPKKMGSDWPDKFKKKERIKERTELLSDGVKVLAKANQDQKWLSELESVFDALATVYRRGRNEVGHPKLRPEVNVVQLRAFLAAFPTFMSDIQRLIVLLNS